MELVDSLIILAIVGSVLLRLWRMFRPGRDGQTKGFEDGVRLGTSSGLAHGESTPHNDWTPEVRLNREDAELSESPIEPKYHIPPLLTIDPDQRYTATMHTSEGAVVFELFPKEAPNTVNSFVFLAREGFYDGVIFHRIIKGFMIQGGDPTGTGAGGPGYQFADEKPVTREYLPGTLAMANAGPNTNGSQFFIMHGEVALPKDYIIFGQVVEGMDVVDALADTPVTSSPTGERSKPVRPPSIEQIDVYRSRPDESHLLVEQMAAERGSEEHFPLHIASHDVVTPLTGGDLTRYIQGDRVRLGKFRVTDLHSRAGLRQGILATVVLGSPKGLL